MKMIQPYDTLFDRRKSFVAKRATMRSQLDDHRRVWSPLLDRLVVGLWRRIDEANVRERQ